jgi:hypothetical protein
MKKPIPSKLTEEKETEASLPGRAVLPIAQDRRTGCVARQMKHEVFF